MFRLLAHPRFIRPLTILSWLVLWAGCAWHPFAKASAVLGAGHVSTVGPVAAPASVTTQDTHTAIPILPGMTVTISTEPARPANKEDAVRPIGEAPAVVLSSHTEQATGPVNFTPPAPPTASEIAVAAGVGKFYWLAVACGAGALGCLYLGHLKAAGICVLGAVGIPFTIHEGHRLAASGIALGCLCVAGALVAAWYLLKNDPALLEEMKAKALALRAKAEKLEGK